MKPQKAQYNSCNFLDHIPSYLDNCGKSRANTCNKYKYPVKRVLVQLLDKPIDPRKGVAYLGGTLDNFADRMASVPTTDLSNVCPINY